MILVLICYFLVLKMDTDSTDPAVDDFGSRFMEIDDIDDENDVRFHINQ